MSRIEKILLSVSIVFYVLSLIIYKLDKFHDFIPVTLFLSFIPTIIVLAIYLQSLTNYKRKLRSVSIAYFAAIVILAIFTRFTLLHQYPFVSIGDELRDGGLHAMEIAEGITKDVFAYGRYEAHGMIIPAINVPLYRLLGSSVLVYRIPSAVLGILNIAVVFVLLSLLTKDKKASFLGSLALLSMPLHLFYSRTEIVVILSSLYSSIFLLAFYVFVRRRAILPIDYALMGLLIGWSFNFHAGIKAMGIVVGLVVIIFSLAQIFIKKIKLKSFVLNMLLLASFIFVGFGPKVLTTTTEIFFNSEKLELVEVSTQAYLVNQVQRYKDSLRVWIDMPTTSHYADSSPILDVSMFALMAYGVIVVCIRKDIYMICVLFILLILHATNSSLTDALNADHRLAAVLPIGAIFIGYGVNFLFVKFKNRVFTQVIFVLFIIMSAIRIVNFYTHQPANLDKEMSEYLLMHAMYLIRRDEVGGGDEYSFSVSPKNHEELNYMHNEEQLKYFLPVSKVTITKNRFAKDNVLYIRSLNEPTSKYSVICNGSSYFCPLGFVGELTIIY